MSKWVRSKYSETAKKWEVLEEGKNVWTVLSDCRCYKTYFPKSEYIECDPHEHWEICTREVVEIDGSDLDEKIGSLFRNVYQVCLYPKYRWAWSEKDPDALVIERKVKE